MAQIRKQYRTPRLWSYTAPTLCLEGGTAFGPCPKGDMSLPLPAPLPASCSLAPASLEQQAECSSGLRSSPELRSILALAKVSWLKNEQVETLLRHYRTFGFHPSGHPPTRPPGAAVAVARLVHVRALYRPGGDLD